MNKTCYSNAEWTEINPTKDEHRNYTAAHAVCSALLWDYGNTPCSIRGYCKRVYVTDANGKILYECKVEDKFIPIYKKRGVL